jgi:hypothetical protein
MSLRAKDPLDIFRKGFSKFWIVLVGVNHYNDPGLHHLRYAVDDCRGLENAIDQVTENFQDKEKLIHCVGSLDSERKNILESLNRVAREAKEDDIVLFYFSGHGHSEANQTYLCLTKTLLEDPAEESIALSELFQSLRHCPAKKQLILVDACHSGNSQSFKSHHSKSAGMITRSAEQQQQQIPSTEMVSAFDYYVKNTVIPGLGFYALLSCDRDQLSYEFSDLKHGVFTHFLIKGLEGEASDAGMIRPLQLFSYVLRKTKEYTEKEQLRQTPRIITNASADFEIGIVQRHQNNLDFQQARQKQFDEYEKIYRDVRRVGSLIQDEIRANLLQIRQQFKLLRESTVVQIEDEINNLFEHCEKYILQYLKLQPLPIKEVCPVEVILACRKELHLQNEDISYVYLRIFKEFNQKFEAYLQQIAALLDKEGLEHGSHLLEFLPEGLSEINISQARHDLIEDYKKRFNNRIEQYKNRVFADLHRYDPLRLEHEASWENLALSLKLNELITKGIEAQCREDYNHKKGQYEIAAKNTIQQYGRSINVDILLEQLQSHQDLLGLSDQVVARICENQFLTYTNRCNQYDKIYTQKAKECYPISEEMRAELLQIQASLEIHTNDIAAIEVDINQEQQDNLNQYRAELPGLVYALYPIDETAVSLVLEPELTKLQQRLELGDRTVQLIKQNIINEYQEVLTNYRKLTQEWLMHKRKTLKDSEVIEALQKQRFFLRDDVTTAIEKEVEQDVERHREQQKNERRTQLF